MLEIDICMNNASFHGSYINLFAYQGFDLYNYFFLYLSAFAALGSKGVMRI
uniref:Uncharacterized protein n=1 Tax=Periwinkle leaf yellowing phytoplasma TaxID=619518 RepID=F2X4V1_9MOLU|nr:hypothetical protein [Periwinkle leaf yellowing phytoplasma]